MNALTGDFVISWESNAQDGSQTGVYAQRFDSQGIKLGNEFRVNTTTANSQSYPTIAMDITGNFVITWQSMGQDGSGNGVYAQRFGSNGTPLGSEFRVNSNTYSEQIEPDIAMAYVNGDFIIAWVDGTNESILGNAGIYFKIYT